MDQQTLITTVIAGMRGQPGLQGLFLAGSLGRGTADNWSDADFIAVAGPHDHQALSGLWRQALEAIAPVVFWNQIDGGDIVLNAITADWLRIDLSIQSPERFSMRARDLVLPLIDRGGLHEGLPATLPARKPSPAKVRYIVNEFIRIIGLTPVVMGRQEYVSAVWGTQLLRNLFIDLLQEEHVTLPDPGGALHLSRLLPPEQMAMLAALPYPGPHRDQLIAAQIALARAFFPVARRLAERVQIDWPTPFEQATRRHLDTTLGPDAIIW